MQLVTKLTLWTNFYTKNYGWTLISFCDLLPCLFIHLMLFDYSNQFIISTRDSYSRQEQRGDKKMLQYKSESHQNTPLYLLDFWALVDPQLVSLSKVQNSTLYLLIYKSSVVIIFLGSRYFFINLNSLNNILNSKHARTHLIITFNLKSSIKSVARKRNTSKLLALNSLY